MSWRNRRPKFKNKRKGSVVLTVDLDAKATTMDGEPINIKRRNGVHHATWGDVAVQGLSVEVEGGPKLDLRDKLERGDIIAILLKRGPISLTTEQWTTIKEACALFWAPQVLWSLVKVIERGIATTEKAAETSSPVVAPPPAKAAETSSPVAAPPPAKE